MFDYRHKVQQIMRDLAFLESTKFLSEEHRLETKKFRSRVEELFGKYRNSPFGNLIGGNLAKAAYEQGMDAALSADRDVSNVVKQQDLKNAYTCTRSCWKRDRGTYCRPWFGPNPHEDYGQFTQEELSEMNRKSSEGGQRKNESAYVSSLNASIQRLRLNLHEAEQMLPKPTSSGMLLLTEVQMQKIQGPSVFCQLQDGEVNNEIQEERQRAISAETKPTRIPPFSQSRSPQHEAMCRVLEAGIPPPYGIKCVYNYKN